MNVHRKIYSKLIYLGISLVVFLLICFVIKNYFRPFITIIAFVFLCDPICNFLYKHSILNRKINAILSILFVNLLLILFIVLLGNFTFNTINNFLKNDYVYFCKQLNIFLDKISEAFKINTSYINESLESLYNNIKSSDFLRKGAVYTTDGVLAYFVGNITAYFILVDKYDIFKFISKFIPINTLGVLNDKFKNLNSIIVTELILVLFTTLETILGFFALGIPNPVILGGICGLLDIIPIIGTILVFLPLIIYEILCKEIIIAIGLLLLYILLQLMRQIMEAKFISRTLNLHPLVIIISLYIGMKLFGIIGLVAGPLYILIAKEILEL